MLVKGGGGNVLNKYRDVYKYFFYFIFYLFNIFNHGDSSSKGGFTWGRATHNNTIHIHYHKKLLNIVMA